MKKIYAAVLIVLMSGLAFAEAGIIVSEKRLDNGDSEITVADNGKVTATYDINMSKHHHPALTKDDPLMKRWSEFKFGAFLCYNLNQYYGEEIFMSKDASLFSPTKLNVRQWVNTFKAAGMDHAVLTVRHTSDFLLWDSVTSDCDVMNSGEKTDIVKQYVEECRRQNIKPGIYYCSWGDWWNPNPNARAIILAQLHELATKYGPIPYFWIDMPHITSWLTKDLAHQEIYDSLKKVNPNGIVMLNNSIYDGSVLKAFPTDVINGELHQPPATGHNPVFKVGGKTYYIPFEYEIPSQQRGGATNAGGVVAGWDFPNASWFTYGEGKSFAASKPFAPAFLYNWIDMARERGASNILLSCAPDYTGSFRKGDVQQLTELGKMLKDPDYIAKDAPLTFRAKSSASSAWPGYGPELAFDNNRGTRWAGADGSRVGWLEVELRKPMKFSKVRIHECVNGISKFELQIKKKDQWQTIHKGTTVGEDYSAKFKPVTAQHVRLNVIEATNVPTIWEIKLFNE